MKLTSYKHLTRMCRRRFKWVRIPAGKWWIFTTYAYVRIRSLTEQEMGMAEVAVLGDQGIDADALLDVKRILISWCVVDEKGEQIFDTKEKIAALGAMDGRAAKALWEACREHCGYTDADVNELVDACAMLQVMSEQGATGNDNADSKVAQWLSYDRRN